MINTELIIKKEKLPLTNDQKTFNKLIKKIKELQVQQETTTQELECALQFYHDTIKPNEEILSQALTERIYLAHQFYKNSNALSETEQEIFKNWLIEQIDQIYFISELSKISENLKEIYKELTGTDFNENFKAGMQDLQKRIENEFGINIDLSDVNPQGSNDDILRNIFLKMRQGAANINDHQNFQEKPKSKKEIEKESKKQAVKEMQTKSLQTIYKQLVRVLHPDLEQDNQKRIWKEELMKKLTSAYDNNDLYSLLSIETEWMNSSVGKMQSQHDEDLKIYNSILKDQIKELENTIEILFMHPRNIPIQKFYPNGFDGVNTLKIKARMQKKEIQEIQESIPLLQKKQATNIFKKIIQEQMPLQILMSKFGAKCTCGTC